MGTSVEELEERFTPIPPSVKQQIEAGEKLFEERGKPVSPLPVQAVPPEQTPEPAPPEEPLVSESPPEEPLVETPAQDVPREKYEKLLQQNKTMKGKLDTELPYLYHQVRFLNEQLQTMQISSVASAEKTEKPVRPVNLRENPKMKALQEEVNPSMFENLAGVLEDVMSDLDNRYKSETDKFRKEITLSKEESFIRDVNRAYPNWKELWSTQEGQTFLSEVEDLTGLTRHQLMTDAYNRMDAIRFVKGLDMMTGKGIPKVDLRSSGPDPAKVVHKVGAPRSNASTMTRAPAPPQTGKETREEAKQKLKDVTAQFNSGRFPGSEADYDKEYARLFAIAGGVRGG